MYGTVHRHRVATYSVGNRHGVLTLCGVRCAGNRATTRRREFRPLTGSITGLGLTIAEVGPSGQVPWRGVAKRWRSDVVDVTHQVDLGTLELLLDFLVSSSSICFAIRRSFATKTLPCW